MCIRDSKTYEQLTLDFGSLTGRDFMAIDREVREREGRVPIVPVYDTSFLMRMVCRASKEKIDYDTIVAAPFAEFNAIRDKARSFLLRTEM